MLSRSTSQCKGSMCENHFEAMTADVKKVRATECKWYGTVEEKDRKAGQRWHSKRLG